MQGQEAGRHNKSLVLRKWDELPVLSEVRSLNSSLGAGGRRGRHAARRTGDHPWILQTRERRWESCKTEPISRQPPAQARPEQCSPGGCPRDGRQTPPDNQRNRAASPPICRAAQMESTRPDRPAGTTEGSAHAHAADGLLPMPGSRKRRRQPRRKHGEQGRSHGLGRCRLGIGETGRLWSRSPRCLPGRFM